MPHGCSKRGDSSRTASAFINLDVVSGHVIEPSWGPTHTEEDALAHLQRLIASDPTATKWNVVLDNLNIHQSESLVRWVAQREGVAAETLGIKGKSGILQSFFFFNDPPPPETYPLPLHDALPIYAELRTRYPTEPVRVLTSLAGDDVLAAAQEQNGLRIRIVEVDLRRRARNRDPAVDLQLGVEIGRAHV